MPTLHTIAVVGGSLAGLRAIEALRRRGYDGRLVWVGAEAHPAYDRPPLSKQLLDGSCEPERLFFRRNNGGYDALDVETHFGRRAVALHARERTVELDDGVTVAYDALVIATGAAARTWATTRPLTGLHPLRTLDDALAIRAALDRSPRVVVIGGGFIGLEVAASCRKRGLEVTVIEATPAPLGDALGERIGTALAGIHHDEGVRVLTGVPVDAVQGAGQVETVKLADGTHIAADLVVAGIGVRPETEWLEGSPVELNDGVVCDARMSTRVPNVVAAGDVARAHNPLTDTHVRVEHWTHAVEQANKAAERLLAGPEATEPLVSAPYFWSDQYDIKIQFAGTRTATDELHVLEGSPEERRLVAVYARDGIVRAAITFNRAPELMRLRGLIRERASLESVRGVSPSEER